jgi:hypothetical protein
MGRILFFSLFASCIICSCSRNTPKAPEAQQAGDFDSAAIAHDTAMQRTLESSYEFAKSINVTGQLVYDVRAFGGPASLGEYAILRTGGNMNADTVAQGARDGIFLDAFTADLNHNGKEEIYITTQSAGTGGYGNVIAWEFDKEGHSTALQFPDPSKTAVRGYMGKDSFFVEHQLLVRRYPLYKEADSNCCPTGGFMQEYYQLRENKFETVKSESVKGEK